MFQSPRGTQDILPEDIPYWKYVEECAKRTALLYGYQEIRTPTFEEAGLFLRGVGTGTDIIEKEMYTFRDKGGSELALKPEVTASIVRAYIEHGMHNRPQPVKLFTLDRVFRYDRPQAGRYRQFHQFNVEAIGEADPMVDVELISLQWRLYEELGLRDLSLQINSIGDPSCRPQYVQALRDYYRQHRLDVCPDCQRRLNVNPLRALDCKEDRCQPIIEGAPRSIDFLCAACAEHFQKLQRYLDTLGIPFALNHRLVRGLDYYTRTVWEVWPPIVGAQSTIGGGGRYDGLAEQLGGRPTPGVGFATGIERVILNLKEQGIPAPSAPTPAVYLAYVGDEAKVRAAQLCDALRREHVSCVLALGDRSLRAQLRQANTLGVRYTWLIGEEELRAQVVRVKDMQTGAEQSVPPDQAISALARLQEGALA